MNARMCNKSNDEIDILFINPRDLSAPAPYIRLAQLSSVLAENQLTSKIIEPAASRVSHSEIIKQIGQCKPAVICLGVFPSTLPDANKTVIAIRKFYPDIPLVLEGYQVNADPNAVLEIGADYGIRGDTEYCFLCLCKSLVKGEEPPEDLSGLLINRQGKLIINPPAFIEEINDLPIPDYGKLPLGKYFSASTNKKYMTVFTARGCPYDCNFCASAAQMKYRCLTEDNVMRHLRHLVAELGVEWIEFMDLTFTISKKRVTAICERIGKAGLNFDWGCETRADLIDDELLNVMKKAGCKKITIGVEAGSETIRFATGKKISNEKFIRAFSLCRKHGIKTMANFIFGHPGEREEEMRETIRFALDLKPFNILFTRMVPLPDVEIFQQGVVEGRIDKAIWYRYMREEVDFPLYYPETIEKKRMDALYRSAYLRFYLSRRTILNYLPLFTDLVFFIKSIFIFFRLTFGKTIYK